MLFEGYTGGGHKEVRDGLMSSGDVGRFGLDGRLYVEGRDDEMIVSGGENVFPAEVEDCLARHARVVEAAAIGVDDTDYGKRLRAFVVVAPHHDQPVRTPTSCVTGSSRTSPATRCPASSSSSTSCPATPRARSSSASWPSSPIREGRVMTGIEIGGPAPDFTLRDQFGQDVTLSSYRGQQGGAAGLLPLRLLQRLHRRDGADPRRGSTSS